MVAVETVTPGNKEQSKRYDQLWLRHFILLCKLVQSVIDVFFLDCGRRAHAFKVTIKKSPSPMCNYYIYHYY